MTTYFITVQFDSRSQRKYVATESDIEMGGFVDANPEDFGFASKEEAEETKKELEKYAEEKGYVNMKFYIEEDNIEDEEED